MLVWITGLRARRVAAFMNNRGAAVDIVDAIAYELENGAIGTLAASGALGPRQSEQQEQPYYGTQGTLRQDFITGAVTLLPRDGGAAARARAGGGRERRLASPRRSTAWST